MRSAGATWWCVKLVQSNNCRQTAASCAKLGLECRLYLSKAHLSTEPQGNLLIDYLVGAKVEFTDAAIGLELNALLAAKADEFRRQGRKPYFWNPPRVVPRAAVSYALCMAEIAEQTAAAYVPCSLRLRGRHRGRIAINTQSRLPYPVRLICPMHWP